MCSQCTGHIAAKALYAVNPQLKQAVAIVLYATNLKPKRAAAKALYAASPAQKELMCKSGIRLIHNVFRAWSVRAYYERQKKAVNFYHRDKYNLKEPNALVKAQVAKTLQIMAFAQT